MKKRFIYFLFLIIMLNASLTILVVRAAENISLYDLYHTNNYDSLHDFLLYADLNDYSNTPNLTFLTPGLGCNWSSWYEYVDFFEQRGSEVLIVEYDRESLSIYGSPIYRPYFSNMFLYNSIFLTELNGVETDEFIDIFDESYINLEYDTSYCFILNLRNDNGSHKIYNFDFNNESQYSKISSSSSDEYNTYDEYVKLVDKLVFSYLDCLPEDEFLIPRINLIGHSRGGILNMQYAIEHPNLVDSLFSIGTPYNGSLLYDLCYFNGLDISTFSNSAFKFDSNALKDCVDFSSYYALKHFWNEYQSNESLFHTKLYAISTSMSFELIDYICSDYDQMPSYITENFSEPLYDLIIGLLLQNEIVDYINLDKSNYKNLLSQNNRYIIGKLVGEFGNININFDIAQIVLTIKRIIDNLSIPSSNVDIDDINRQMENHEILENLTSNEKISLLGEVVKNILENAIFDNSVGMYVVENDFFVDKNSQLATGYDNVIEYEKILTDENIQVFDESLDIVINSFRMSCNPDWPIVGHNLETKDLDIINCVLSNIVLGPSDNGLNIINDSSDNKIVIGYSPRAAIKNGVLSFDGDEDYILSDKCFSKDYTIARAPINVDNDYYPPKASDEFKIDEIHFNTNIELQKESLCFLEGMIKFEKASDVVVTYKLYNNLSAIPCTFLNNSILCESNSILVKNGNNNFNTDIVLNNVYKICDGAFFAQNIQRISINNTDNRTDIQIGKYAFYGCSSLDSIDISNNISFVGPFAFYNSKIYKNKDTNIVSNVLVSANQYGPLIITNSSPITFICQDAFLNNKYCNYLVIEKPYIYYQDYCFRNPYLDSMIIYTNNFNVDENNFDSCSPFFYSYYSFSDDFINESLSNHIDVYFDGPNNLFNMTMTLSSTMDNPISSIDNNITILDKEVLGFVDDYNATFIDEPMTEFNFFDSAKKVYYLYYVCEDSADHEYEVYSEHNQATHIEKCLYCCDKKYANHDFTYSFEEDSIYHNKTCSCGYDVLEYHISSIDSISSDNVTHISICDKCGIEFEDIHEFTYNIQIVNNEFVLVKQCIFCNYYIIQQSINITDNGETHHLSTGEDLSHDYEDLIFGDLTMQFCKYCFHHEHDGLVSHANSDIFHYVYCYICDEVREVTHNFNDYLNINNDLEDGYHSKTCEDCGQLVYEDHHYYFDDDYNDLHHLKCADCGATTIYYHTPAISTNPTDDYHTIYCDICNCYYYVLHNFEFYGNINGDSSGHFEICVDCGFIRECNHNYSRLFNHEGHYDQCVNCGYQTPITQHNLLFNCLSTDPHNHYAYCSYCDYHNETPLQYTIYHEYEHYCKCTICNTQIIEPHLENCVYYNELLHIYMCELCNINYEMPHFVNDHLIIYENYEQGYDLWVCTYCGYMERRRRDN